MSVPHGSEVSAAAELNEIARAEAMIRRHSANSGRLPLLWGALLVALFSTFALVPYNIAVGILIATILIGAPLTVWRNHARRKVEGRRAAGTENSVLMFCWAIYFFVIYSLWSPGSGISAGSSWFLFGLFAAAPLLLGGGVMWLRGRR